MAALLLGGWFSKPVFQHSHNSLKICDTSVDLDDMIVPKKERGDTTE